MRYIYIFLLIPLYILKRKTACTMPCWATIHKAWSPLGETEKRMTSFEVERNFTSRAKDNSHDLGGGKECGYSLWKMEARSKALCSRGNKEEYVKRIFSPDTFHREYSRNFSQNNQLEKYIIFYMIWSCTAKIIKLYVKKFYFYYIFR